MQLSAVCTECKEMFLFTDDLLYVRPILIDTKALIDMKADVGELLFDNKIRPICFRCSTTVGACQAVSVTYKELRVSSVEAQKIREDTLI